MTPERTRRSPPPFRRARVEAVERLTARLVRVTLAGPELRGMPVPQPAASVRLLLPETGADDVELPEWDGNRFVLPEGQRPTLRTLTPRRTEPGPGRLEVQVVVHGAGAASHWAETAGPGTPAAVSGPGRGYEVDATADAYLLGGDETAAPAIGQLLEALPRHVPVEVHLELADLAARPELPGHPRARVHWHELPPEATPGAALEAAVRDAGPEPGTRIWLAGEAAAVQRIRHHLFSDRGLPRSEAAVRGYWKHGRAGDGDPAAPS